MPLPAGSSVSSELQELNDSGDKQVKEGLVKRVKAVIDSGDEDLLFAANVNGIILLLEVASHGLVDSTAN